MIWNKLILVNIEEKKEKQQYNNNKIQKEDHIKINNLV